MHSNTNFNRFQLWKWIIYNYLLFYLYGFILELSKTSGGACLFLWEHCSKILPWLSVRLTGPGWKNRGHAYMAMNWHRKDLLCWPLISPFWENPGVFPEMCHHRISLWRISVQRFVDREKNGVTSIGGSAFMLWKEGIIQMPEAGLLPPASWRSWISGHWISLMKYPPSDSVCDGRQGTFPVFQWCSLWAGS